MINKRLIEQLKKTNESIAKHFEEIGKLSDDQYNEIVKMIEKVKQEKKDELVKQKKEAVELQKSASKIKNSNKVDIKKKGKIDSYLSSISSSTNETIKKQKTLNKVTDKLIEKTESIKKESISLLSMFQKKEITREFKLTFTDTSKITTKSIVFKNSIIENVSLGQSHSSSSSKYKEKKIKLLKSISKRFDVNVQSNDTGTQKQIEQPKVDSSPSVATEVGTGATSVGIGALAKKYLPKVLSKGGAPTEEAAAKLGSGILTGGFKTFAKALPIIGGIIGTVAAIKSLVDRIPASIKGYQDYEAKGLHKAAVGQLGSGLIGSAGDIIGGISSWVPGPLGWLGMGAGFALSEFGDSLAESSKDYKDDKKMFGVEPSDNKTQITLDKLNDAKKQIKKDNDNVSQMDAINYLAKRNQQDFISALGGKSKSFLLPKYEFDGNFIITPEELKLRGSIADASTILPSNPYSSLGSTKNMEAPVANTMTEGTSTDMMGMFNTNQIVTSSYQMNRTIKTNQGIISRSHKGIDLGASDNTPLKAPMSGTVSYELDAAGYGNNIKLKTDDGYTLIFGHLSSFGADKNGKVGETKQVKRGDLIGFTGHSGIHSINPGKTGAHLHFEVRNSDNVAIDPKKWMDTEKNSVLKNVYSLPSVETPTIIDMHKEGYKYGKEAALIAVAKLKGK